MTSNFHHAGNGLAVFCTQCRYSLELSNSFNCCFVALSRLDSYAARDSFVPRKPTEEKARPLSLSLTSTSSCILLILTPAVGS